MNSREKMILALMILKYLASEQTTHHWRKILAQLAFDLINDNPTSARFAMPQDDANDIPF